MAKGSIREALDQVGATFKANFREDPTRESKNKLLPILKLQLNRYKQADPKKDQQRCLNPGFICQCLNCAVTKLQKIIEELITLGFFFAIRSCEFSEASGERKTKIITISGI